MLVLSRRISEELVIAGNITITVVGIDRGKVKLGIEAPPEVPVMRQELLTRQRGKPDRGETA
jgi:carbon storage regulator